ncbi:hypothetical protein NQ314_006070 [Rhamnusium bicolor]|uniref:Uncharacterized protein n=1 Tax=Rhamnusium bicolor TaxID=1586634 RepID=A0AAV8Z9W7_9CUCU|nr:hypothetical protein NQ314_006070 [Rhamnusium bicolor]
MNSKKLKKGDIYALQKGNVKVIKWMDKRPVSMLSTCSNHNATLIETGKTQRNGDAVKKPLCVLDYNNAKKRSRFQPRKRKQTGRMRDAAKKMRTQTHETGEDCKFTKLKCFQNINVEEQRIIIKEFNVVPTYDSQNKNVMRMLLSTTIHIVEVPICYKAIISLHGITPRRLQTIQNQMTTHGKVLSDKRGRHKNRPHALSQNTLTKVNEHIQSLQGRKSHYSLNKSEKLYLPDELSVKKLHEMYLEKFKSFPISYHSYRKIFITDYNISFGYPRYDTCSKCDEFTSQESILKKEDSRS